MANGMKPYPLTPEARLRAQMTVCSFAEDVDEARGFLEMLDIG